MAFSSPQPARSATSQTRTNKPTQYPTVPAPEELEMQAELERIYTVRFSGLEDYRNRVWQALVGNFFSRWIKATDTVLDVGCGYGEFINNLPAQQKFGMDLNPKAKEYLRPDIQLIEQDCGKRWPLPDIAWF
jgi:SAM-dependent methyltransferase